MSNLCMHGRLTSFVAADDGEPVGLWACAFCARKFAPLDVTADAERQRWRDVVAHAVDELEAIDDETAQLQAMALRELTNDA